MRSRTVIIGDERQEDFDRLAAGWRAEFDFEGQAAESLLERVIREDWFLRRAEGVCMDAEAEMAEVPPLERTAEQHAQMQLYLRYKTTAERSFYRAYYALRGLRKDKLKEELDFDKLRQKMDKYAVEALEKASVEREEKAQARVKEAAGSQEASGVGRPPCATKFGCTAVDVCGTLSSVAEVGDGRGLESTKKISREAERQDRRIFDGTNSESSSADSGTNGNRTEARAANSSMRIVG